MATNENVSVFEVGPRDGLQNIAKLVPTGTKIELIRRLARTGLRCIEITSIVSPKAVPQLSDCRTILSSGILADLQDIRTPVLIPNLKRLETALELGPKEIAVFISATDGFSRANLKCSAEEGLKQAQEVAREARSQGLEVRGYVSCIFADPFTGPTSLAAVLHHTKALLDAGCYQISLGDTLGVGTPSQTTELLRYLKSNSIPMPAIAGHFHDTYGQALANVWAAYLEGVKVFDSSVGGLGGCPFAPGAKGNLATEDLVYMFHGANIETGIDFDKLAKIGKWICSQIGVPNSSRAGAAALAKASVSNPRPSPKTQIMWVLETPDTAELLVYRAEADVKLVLNRPQKGNCLNKSLVQLLTDQFRAIRSDPSISRVVLTSAGNVFCAGMDLAEAAATVDNESLRDELYSQLSTLLELIDTAPQVTIAGITGPAYGGGCGLALACDIRLATEKASLTMTEIRLGLCPAVISKYIIRELGISRAREAMLSARTLMADELSNGAVFAKVVPDSEALDSALSDCLARLRLSAPQAAEMCKRLIHLGWKAAGSEEQEEGMRLAFRHMLAAGSPGAYGVAQYRAGRKDIDWSKNSRSKL